MHEADLLAAFEAGAIDNNNFSHAHHVHVAWGLAHRYGGEEGLERMVSGIKRLAESAGRPEAFHLTITRAWFLLITGVEDLRSAPELLDKTILSRYYSSERLGAGRSEWLEPDLHPLRLPLPPAAQESATIKDLLASVPAAVGVLTTQSSGCVHATTVSSITSVSAAPPLISICLANESRALKYVRAAEAFVLSVLASDQSELADRFATRDRPEGAAQFADVPHHSGEFGPVLEQAVASLGCRVHAVHPCGDHHIVVGEIASVDGSSGKQALLRQAGAYVPKIEVSAAS